MGMSDEKINEIIDSGLPIIRIVKEWDEMYTHLELEMEDDTKAMLVRWGKEVATDDDYSEIAIREGLKEFVADYDRRKKEEQDEDNN